MDKSFGVVDYAVFITMLIISGGIGVYYRFSGGKQKTNNVSLVCFKLLYSGLLFDLLRQWL